MKRIILACLCLISLPLLSDAQSRKKVEEIEDLVLRWSADNSSQDMLHLASMYAPVVNFYGKQKDVQTCMKDKEAFFQKNIGYTINIDDVEVDFYKSGAVKANFSKIEHWGGKDNYGQGYLVFEKQDGKWVITQESDQRMDSVRQNTPQMGEKKYRSNILPVIIVVGVVSLVIVIFVLRKSKKKETAPEQLHATPTVYSASNQPQAQKQDDGDEQSAKGKAFEAFVIDLFDKAYFTLHDWRSDKKTAEHYPLSNMYPDVRFLYKDSYRQVEFALECKWRRDFFNDTIEWAKEYQLKNYRDYEMQYGHPVFVILGVGGSPSQPSSVYVIPLKDINSCVFTRDYLAKYYRYKKGKFFLELPGMRLQ